MENRFSVSNAAADTAKACRESERLLGLQSLLWLVTGDNGTMHFWDWKSGYNFQRLQSAVQPGSIDSESGIFASIFDKSSSRLITCEADKTIKIYKEDETAVSSIVIVFNENSVIVKNCRV